MAGTGHDMIHLMQTERDPHDAVGIRRNYGAKDEKDRFKLPADKPGDAFHLVWGCQA
ncbi:hypothetical protein JCM15831A_04080 [Asaia astilbis]